ncbi:P-loop containing nucleoside triphosphate hydrolase protein [Dendrothele bispora CBS 962.96]|uniref:RNA helicase n=1 Tax=Dendrothele bispora (strain CBS 962.96) TaxID=1314807 RepID=A0A4S8MV93_DENBC|nr:P-loop containing nucleoside triphosphate hydrolase protein [Dendrothele bispora CBS 962.96]
MSSQPFLHNPTFCYVFASQPGGQGCTKKDCKLRHDVLKCLCGLVLPISDYASHSGGKRHQDAMNGKPLRPRTTSNRIGPGSKRAHSRGLPTRQQQQQASANLYFSSDGQSVKIPWDEDEDDGRDLEWPTITSSKQMKSIPMPTSMRCPKCSREVPTAQYKDHVESHETKQRLAVAREEAERDKFGIKVEGKEGVDFGVVEEGEEPMIRLEITRECEHPPPPLVLSKCRMLSSTRKDSYGERFSAALIGSQWVNPGRPRVLVVTFHPSYAGRYEDVIELVFWDRKLRQRFVIHRRVSAIVGDKEDHDLLKPKSPYVRRRRRTPLQIDGPVKKSLRPTAWTKTEWKTRLDKYDVPTQVTDVLYKRGIHSRREALERVKGLIPSYFTVSSYGKRFQLMLYLEEEQMKQDLDAYAMEDAQLKSKYPSYELEVEGLSEGRPSVLVGDFILVRHTHSTEKTWYQGRVHRVDETKVRLRFGDEFSTYKGTSFNVRFVLNRLPLRRMHDAVTNKYDPMRFLFPGPEHVSNMRRVTRRQMDDIVPINRLVGSDPEQLETVAAIVNMPSGSPPFVVFGPPGTGKTVTLVEVIRQLLALDSNIRILACTPSNSAADIITQRLSVLGPSQLFRLNSLSRKLTELPEGLKKFCLINGNEVFAMPTLDDLLKYRVIVSTCASAGVPSSLGVPRGFYSHIFVDEAGQATEPAVMIPIKTLADEKTNVVLAGDIKQLGPVVHSALASSLGLRMSYLERIMNREIYDLGKGVKYGGKGVTIVKLVKNFRTHEAILRFSNERFYNNELQYCADPALTHGLENSSELPTKRFPLIFHGIVGKDLREETSPSFFNIEEATLVKKYCSSLIGERKKGGVRPDDIGIITPYHAQRMKILNLLYRDPKLRDIRVGSVEEFQGQERKVIIISTVRSSTEFIHADITRTLGFVASPHRFNVAITRAQALLVVIGNPMVLSLDPLWRSFLSYIHNNGGWRGVTISWDPKASLDEEIDAYDEQMRRQAVGEAEEEMTRLKALITRKNEEIEDGWELDLSDEDEDDGPGFGFGEGRVFREDD